MRNKRCALIRVSQGTLFARPACITTGDMRGDKTSQVLSIRIEPNLLRAVRARASDEGRSVSGAIVSMVRQQMGESPAPRAASRPISGWLADLDVPGTLAEFRQARAEVSATLARSTARKARRTPKRRRA